MEFFDSHTHLQFAAFDRDRDEVVNKTLSQGVGFINIGTNLGMSGAALELARKYQGDHVYATVGLHPVHTYDSEYVDKEESVADKGPEVFSPEEYMGMAEDKKVLAIGECGLDYFRLGDESVKEIQKREFLKQIGFAKEVKKPLMVHCRPSEGSDDAYEDLYNLVKNESVPLIMHFFAGGVDTAKKFVELGSYFTFGGVVTFTRSYDEVVYIVPLDRILLETDAPYVAPKEHRGERNEPLYIKETYERVAKLKKVEMDKLRSKVFDNNNKIFGITLDT